jgi:hypothetical protein
VKDGIFVLDQTAFVVGEHLLGGEARDVDAAVYAALHQIEQRGARPRVAWSEPINLQIAAVGDDQAQVAVVGAQAVGHVLERCVEQQIALVQRILLAQPGGNVLVNRHPPAIRHRAERRFDHLSVSKAQPMRTGILSPHHGDAPIVKLLGFQVRMLAGLDRVIQDLTIGDAWLDDRPIESVDAQILLVANNETFVRVEQAQPLRHVADRLAQVVDLVLEVACGL